MPAKRQLPRRRYDIALKDDLDGFHATMTAMTGKEVLTLLRGEMGADVVDLIAQHCVEHDFPVDDIRELDMWMLEQLVDQWQEAMNDTALPPTSAEPSRKGSAS